MTNPQPGLLTPADLMDWLTPDTLEPAPIDKHLLTSRAQVDQLVGQASTRAEPKVDMEARLTYQGQEPQEDTNQAPAGLPATNLAQLEQVATNQEPPGTSQAHLEPLATNLAQAEPLATNLEPQEQVDTSQALLELDTNQAPPEQPSSQALPGPATSQAPVEPLATNPAHLEQLATNLVHLEPPASSQPTALATPATPAPLDNNKVETQDHLKAATAHPTSTEDLTRAKATTDPSRE